MKIFENTHKVVLALVVGFVVGFGFGWFVFSDLTAFTEEADRGETTEEDVLDTQEQGETTTTPNISLGGALVDRVLVEVKDQEAGGSVFISRVALENPGWVAIHEDVNGEPGAILGAKRFDGGTYQGSVNLLRGTTAGNLYHATVWEDDGDREFSHDNDRILSGAEGGLISIMFEVY